MNIPPDMESLFQLLRQLTKKPEEERKKDAALVMELHAALLSYQLLEHLREHKGHDCGIEEFARSALDKDLSELRDKILLTVDLNAAHAGLDWTVSKENEHIIKEADKQIKEQRKQGKKEGVIIVDENDIKFDKSQLN